jgi:hypothetical protein
VENWVLFATKSVSAGRHIWPSAVTSTLRTRTPGVVTGSKKNPSVWPVCGVQTWANSGALCACADTTGTSKLRLRRATSNNFRVERLVLIAAISLALNLVDANARWTNLLLKAMTSVNWVRDATSRHRDGNQHYAAAAAARVPKDTAAR